MTVPPFFRFLLLHLWSLIRFLIYSFLLLSHVRVSLRCWHLCHDSPFHSIFAQIPIPSQLQACYICTTTPQYHTPYIAYDTRRLFAMTRRSIVPYSPSEYNVRVSHDHNHLCPSASVLVSLV